MRDDDMTEFHDLGGFVTPRQVAAGIREGRTYKLATPASGDAVAVDDAMVERACAEWWGSDWGTWTGYQADSKRAKARRILHAALRTGGGGS